MLNVVFNHRPPWAFNWQMSEMSVSVAGTPLLLNFGGHVRITF